MTRNHLIWKGGKKQRIRLSGACGSGKPSAIQVMSGVWKITYGVPERITPVSVRASGPANERFRYLPKTSGQVPLTPANIYFKTNARGCLLELPFDQSEGIFGFGLQLKSHLQSGKKKLLRVNADPIADTGDSHAPVPFYASTKGYAVFIDTARYASIYLGAHSNPSTIRKRLAEKNGKPPIAVEDIYRLQAIGEKVVIDIPSAGGVDLYLFEGPDIRSAVSRYVLFSGGGCLPPLWGLGNWYRACTRHNDADVLSLIADFEKDRMPFNVIGLEPGWQSRFYPNSYEWGKGFPDPLHFIKDLRARGYCLNLWENAFIHPEAPFFSRIKGYCGDQLGTDGLVPDFLHRRALKIFADHHDKTLISLGVSGFKLDECDNSDFTQSAWSFPEYTQFPSGADGEQMHSLFGVHYQHALDGIFRKRRTRHYGLARSSGALAASLPYVLYSDLYDHSDFVRGLVNAGFSGLLWTPEVRDAESPEDLVRRIQTVILSPLSLINGWDIPRPPWKQVKRNLNELGVDMPEKEKVTRLVREALHLRIKLLPYLYTAFFNYYRSGTPPFRALAMDYPKDRKTWQCEGQFMIGSDILAAPILAAEKKKTVYLPEGTWCEFLSGKRHSGSSYHTLSKPALGHIPLYVREGTILPLAEVVDAVRPGCNLIVRPHIYGSNDAKGELYEDDGLSYEYQEGHSIHYRLSWHKASGFHISSEGSNGKARMYHFEEACNV